MIIPVAGAKFESEFLAKEWKPVLNKAFNIYKEEWMNGNRSRELSFRLMFLAWFGLTEPDHVTGFQTEISTKTTQSLVGLFKQIFFTWEPKVQTDAEGLYIMGVMIYIDPNYFEDVGFWVEKAKEFKSKFRKICPEGLDPASFNNRGVMGNFFKGQCEINEGNYF